MPTVSGEYFLPPVYEATPGTVIRADQHNVPLRDIAQGLTDRLMRNGTSPMTGNLPMNGNKVTGMGAATAAGDAVRKSQMDTAEASAKDLSNATGVLDVAHGGTGGNTAAAARTSLEAVGYAAQTLTGPQRAQARANIQAIGTDVGGQLLPLPGNDLDTQDTLPTGVFSFSATTVGRPVGTQRGTVYIGRRTVSGGETQFVISDNPSVSGQLLFVRGRWADGWSPWSEIIHGATAAEARSKLNLGSLATQNTVAIVGDTTGTLPLNRGGTGGNTAAAARAGIGITAAAGGIARLNESVNHIDSSWVSGVSELPGIASPKQIADAIGARALGVGQTWVDVSGSRSTSTWYLNTTGRPIIAMAVGDTPTWRPFQVRNGTSGGIIEIASIHSGGWFGGLVPPGWSYQINGGGINGNRWVELR